MNLSRKEDANRGEQALADIKKALDRMTPEQVRQFSWMAAGMAVMAEKCPEDTTKTDKPA